MHISSLSLRNYRNFKNSKFLFKKGINTIIGENGCGKTNLFNAIRILIDNSMPRYIRFGTNDFARSLEKWEGHWIILSIEFEDLDASEEAQSLLKQAIGSATEKGGSYSIYFRPKFNVRKALFDYSKEVGKDKIGLSKILSSLTVNDYEALYLSRGTGDFNNEDVYIKCVGNFETIEFPDPEKDDGLVLGVRPSSEINMHDEISCTFIKALRDVESDLKSYSTNPLINLLRGQEKTIDPAKQSKIITGINDLNTTITGLDEVVAVREGIGASLKQAVGTTYSPSIDIKSELPNEMDKLFQSLKLWVGDADESGYMGRIWEMSLGGANLVYLSLKLLEYERVRNDKIANFLLIEEPEAHIHTHIQKTLFENLKSDSTQVIVSTHSTHISSVSKISSVNVVCRGGNQSHVFQPSNGLNDDEITRLERYLDAVRSNLLFAKGVILVEGDAEQIVIPSMFQKSFGISLDEIGVSLINIGSTGFENIAKIFHEDRVQKFCSILTDLDKSIVALPSDLNDDDEFQRDCRNSEKSGSARKKILDQFCMSNPYIKPFYAKHTFEVDLFDKGNSYEFKNTVDKVYKKQENIDAAKTRLDSADSEIHFKEVLRLAAKVGKGWFALLLSDQLLYNTYFPTYILKAIAYSSSHINTSSKVKAIKYRINEIANNSNDEAQDDAKKFKFDPDEQTVIIDFLAAFPEDQLTEFLELL